MFPEMMEKHTACILMQATHVYFDYLALYILLYDLIPVTKICIRHASYSLSLLGADVHRTAGTTIE